MRGAGSDPRPQGYISRLPQGLGLRSQLVCLTVPPHPTTPPLVPSLPASRLHHFLPALLGFRMTLTWAPFHCPPFHLPCLFPTTPCELPEDSPCPGLGPWDPYPPAQPGTSSQSFTGLLPLVTSLCAQSPPLPDQAPPIATHAASRETCISQMRKQVGAKQHASLLSQTAPENALPGALDTSSGQRSGF